MKRILIFFTTAGFLFSLATSTFGVDKKEKKETPKTEKRSDSTVEKKESSTVDSSKKKYDDFIDLNKNGKDDRCENRKSKSAKAAPAKLTQEKPTVKKTVSAVTNKGDKKVDSTAKKPK